MTTETQQMLAALGLLHDDISGKLGEIDQRLNTAEQRVGDTLRKFYLDQANGNDANDGTQEAPLASMREVNARSVFGGATVVDLLSDYTEQENITSLWTGTLKINCNNNTLSWAEHVADNSAGAWRFNLDVGSLGQLVIENGTIRVGNAPATASDFGRTFIRSRGLALSVYLISCDVDVAPDPVGADRVHGSFMSLPGGLLISSTSYDTAMAGRWLRNVAAGTAPASIADLTYTNLASL